MLTCVGVLCERGTIIRFTTAAYNMQACVTVTSAYNGSHPPKKNVNFALYRVSQEVKVYRYNPKHLYPKLNGYGDNGQRNLKL